MATWYFYFKQRADDCGLPVPDSPYKTAAAGLALIKAFTDCAKDLGPRALTKMPLLTFLGIMRNRAAFDAAVKAQLEGFLQRGLAGRAIPIGAQMGTASGAVTTGLGMLASAYIGGIIGCAIYACDKCLGGGLDDAITGASTGFWNWFYGVDEKQRENDRMEAKLQLMRHLRTLAARVGMQPSQMAEEVARGDFRNFNKVLNP